MRQVAGGFSIAQRNNRAQSGTGIPELTRSPRRRGRAAITHGYYRHVYRRVRDHWRGKAHAAGAFTVLPEPVGATTRMRREKTTIPRMTTIVMIAVSQSITPKPAIAGR
jgi:hypothetical protein